MINLKIDHIELQAEEGTTVLEAARQAGIEIPSMCHLKGHGNHPSCMVCLVKDGNSESLIPSCTLRVSPGMEIIASDEEVMVARRQALELLLSDHVGDCEAPCSLACPAGMNIPLMNRLIGESRFTEALNIVKEEIALPHILGYVCPAPCEKACRRKQIDDAVSVCLLKRFSAAVGTDERSTLVSQMRDKTNHASLKKVAIIGSGPAGLAAAYYLQLYGHSCTVFEKAKEAGGTLRYSISEEDLPKNIIDSEVEIIKSTGATFRFNTPVTEQIFNDEIKGAYNAVVIATGDIATGNQFASLIAVTKSGFMVNEKDMSSSVPGIFVCGSAIRPHKMAVRSVAQGKTAAESVHHYLQAKQYEKPGRMFNSRFDKLQPAEFEEYVKESSKSGRIFPGSAGKDGFTPDEAVREALRCLHCDCRKKDNCLLRDYSNEYQADRKHYMAGERKLMTRQVQHDLIIYEPEKCIKCGICVEISCKEGERFGLAFEGRGFDVVINIPMGIPFNEGLTHAAVKCATACPTGALAVRDMHSKIHLKSQTE